MATPTPNYAFDKPAIGSDDDVWGGFLNGNWDSVDTILQDLEDRLAVEEAEVSIPIGTIMIWHSTIASIPTGWGWCDGSTYTRTDAAGTIDSPNLTGMLVVGATGDASGTDPVGTVDDYDGSGSGANYTALAYIMKI